MRLVATSFQARESHLSLNPGAKNPMFRGIPVKTLRLDFRALHSDFLRATEAAWLSRGTIPARNAYVFRALRPNIVPSI